MFKGHVQHGSEQDVHHENWASKKQNLSWNLPRDQHQFCLATAKKYPNSWNRHGRHHIIPISNKPMWECDLQLAPQADGG